MSFTSITTVVGMVGLLLGAEWLVSGRVYFRQWSMEAPEQALVVGRRIGAVFLGISLMLFLGRSGTAEDVRTGVLVGLALALGMEALLGLIELRAGRMGRGILVGVTLEVLLTAGLISALCRRLRR